MKTLGKPRSPSTNLSPPPLIHFSSQSPFWSFPSFKSSFEFSLQCGFFFPLPSSFFTRFPDIITSPYMPGSWGALRICPRHLAHSDTHPLSWPNMCLTLMQAFDPATCLSIAHACRWNIPFVGDSELFNSPQWGNAQRKHPGTFLYFYPFPTKVSTMQEVPYSPLA